MISAHHFNRKLASVVGAAASAALCAVAAISSSAAQAPSSCTLAVVNITVIDGTGADPQRNGVITISDDRITQVGSRRDVDLSGCGEEIDGRGKYVTPGFIDTNVHIAMLRQPIDFARYFDRLEALAIEGAQLHLKYGVTYVRDSYGVMEPLLKARDAIRDGEAVGADILVAGNIVGWGGHFSDTFRGRPPENYFEEWINDQHTRGSGELLAWMSPDELREAINAYIDHGVDFIKVGVTDHNHNSPQLIFSQRQLNAIVETAHERGLMAEVHATSPEGMIMSLDAGVDLIQHPEVIGVPITDEVLARLDAGEAICSIHGNNHAGRAWRDVEKRETARTSEKASQEAVGANGEPGATMLRNWAKPEETEAAKQKALVEANSRNFRENAEKILDTQCIITTATDNSMGRPPEFMDDPNRWHAREPGLGTLATIESLVEMGLTPKDAIVAATKNGAIALGRLDDLGTIEAGKIADLVLFDKNPLRDIANVHAINAVIKRGVLIDPADLPKDPVFYRQQAGTEASADDAAQ